MSVGPRELLVIFLVAMILFGGSRIADIGKGLGEGIRNFKKAVKDDPNAPKPGSGVLKAPEGQEESSEERSHSTHA
jgi:sec-independent protein translocase protein TatA